MHRINQILYFSMNKRTFFALLILVSCLAYRCVPPSQGSVDTNVNMSLSDPTIQKLYDFQDKLLTDSLINYFTHKNPSLRCIAAAAMGNIQDPKALVGLESLLKDPAAEVRTAAAFSLGQLGDSTATRALLEAFDRLDTLGGAAKFNATILEAVGKIASPKYLKPLATISSYKNTDTTLLEGQCYGIYRFMQRGVTNPEATQLMISYASDSRKPTSVKVIAANFLARAKNITLDSVASTKLSAILSIEANYKVRVALAKALQKSTTGVAMYALVNQLGRDTDYRVKVACMQALGAYRYDVVSPVIRNYLYIPDEHLAKTAANYFIEHGQGTQMATADYWNLAKDSTLSPVVQLMMYQAANRHVSNFMPNTKTWLNADIYKKLDATEKPTEKIACLRALAEYGWNYRSIKDKGFQTQSPQVRTSTIEILGNICQKPDFYRTFGKGANQVRIDMYSYMLEALRVGDPGMVASAAGVLRSPEMGFKYFYAKMLDKTFLTQAQNKLKLPRDIEAWNELQKTIDFFNGAAIATPNKVPDYNQPIDWKLLNSYNNAITATMVTKYGTVVIDLYREKAPGTVVNFIQLANNGFYNGKTFHRVISNFMAQGGCTRGDGYGSLDYTIRSELSAQHWDDEGYIGMASAGRHTEGTQFFISHMPTFHLDGYYTIFGKVRSGMEIIHKIQQGDIIEKITVK